MPIQKILSRFSGKMLFEVKAKNFKTALEMAVHQRADLQEADLQEADLRGADLRRADLRRADLQEADLQEADLREADFRRADLRRADLRGADLRRADLQEADLRGAGLWEADLWEAELRGAKDIDLAEVKRRAHCPLAGEFIAWKKGGNGEIIKLKIPAFVRRVSPIIGRKCRAELAIVLEIEDRWGDQITECTGGYDSNLKYRIDEFVSPDGYDPSPLIECSHGIHFFITRQEAMD